MGIKAGTQRALGVCVSTRNECERAPAMIDAKSNRATQHDRALAGERCFFVRLGLPGVEGGVRCVERFTPFLLLLLLLHF